MREIRPSGSEGGVADNSHPYPYPPSAGLDPRMSGSLPSIDGSSQPEDGGGRRITPESVCQ